MAIKQIAALFSLYLKLVNHSFGQKGWCSSCSSMAFTHKKLTPPLSVVIEPDLQTVVIQKTLARCWETKKWWVGKLSIVITNEWCLDNSYSKSSTIVLSSSVAPAPLSFMMYLHQYPLAAPSFMIEAVMVWEIRCWWDIIILVMVRNEVLVFSDLCV